MLIENACDTRPGSVLSEEDHKHIEQCDRNDCQRILPRNPRYLGLLGPKARTERLFKELGVTLDEGVLNAPVGLDIGADTPESIALSIAAEIQAVISARQGGMLKHREDSIHAPVIEEGKPAQPDSERIRFEYGCELASSN